MYLMPAINFARNPLISQVWVQLEEKGTVGLFLPSFLLTSQEGPASVQLFLNRGTEEAQDSYLP